MSNYEYYYTYDDPVPYKKLLLYPATMRDYLIFYSIAEILAIDKNSTATIENFAEVINMTYLEFLYKNSTEENKYKHISYLDGILKICLRNKEQEIQYKYIDKKPFFEINGELYGSDDFDEIRNIICEYNLVDVPDLKIEKKVRDKMKEAEDLRRRIAGVKMASLEDQIISVMISTPLKLNDVMELSIRKFSKILQRVDHKLHYQIYLSASMSGFVKFKDKNAIKHWMADLTRDRFENTVSLDDIRNKIEFKNI